MFDDVNSEPYVHLKARKLIERIKNVLYQQHLVLEEMLLRS